MSSTPPYPTRDLYPMSPPIVPGDSYGNPSSSPFTYPGPPHMYPKITADNADDIALRNLMQPMKISGSTYDPNFGLLSDPPVCQQSGPVDIIIPPRTVTLGYDPGFELPTVSTSPDPSDAVEMIIPPRTVDLGYDPGFELPNVSTSPDPSDAVEIIIPPRTVDLGYDPGFELPNVPNTPEPSDAVEILIAPRTVAVGYDPGFELPEPSEFPENSHPSNADDTDNPFPEIRDFVSERTFNSVFLSGLNPYGQTSCDPDDDERGPPPPVGFIFQHPDLPNDFAYPQVSYPSLSGSAPVLESEEDSSETQKEDAVNIEHHCRWVGASSSDCNVQGAFLVGHDQDGSPIYAGRAYHNGDNVPAKVIPSKQVAYISYGGEEIAKDQFEMMCPPVYSWQWASGGNIPHTAVEFGNTADGEILYLGRVNHEGTLTPGKVQRSHGCCYFPFDGQEVCAQTYEVLVLQ